MAKRARHPRAAEFLKSFSKDWERLDRAGRHDMRQAKEAVLLLIAADSPLGPEWRDHPLKGVWIGHRECHVGGDFLLVYKLDDDAARHGKLYFIRLGNHTELFNE